ncbi:AMP-binding protein, partial [bacterium]|nr:AMP-binding protein [bacterium]
MAKRKPKVTANITSILNEKRVFKPSSEFSRNAHVKSFTQYKRSYRSSIKNIQKFWAGAASELTWFRRWKRILDWRPPFAKWFIGGQINVSYNCLDRHLSGWRRNKAAIIWEGEPGETRTLTYQQLHSEVCRFANVLRRLGVVKGDRVILYMPLVPELAIAMLACTRIGATHSIIFGGFSSQALVDRIQ